MLPSASIKRLYLEYKHLNKAQYCPVIACVWQQIICKKNVYQLKFTSLLREMNCVSGHIKSVLFITFYW